MAEIIKTLGGTLTYTAGNHRYTWNGERVDLSVSGVASSFPLNFGAASGWAAKMIREELISVESPTGPRTSAKRHTGRRQKLASSAQRFTLTLMQRRRD